MQLSPWLAISLILHGAFLVSLPHWMTSLEQTQHSLPQGTGLPKLKLVRMEAPQTKPSQNQGLLPMEPAAEASPKDPAQAFPSSPPSISNSSTGVLAQLPALPLKNPPPEYPLEARRIGIEGSVRLCFQVSTSGQVSAIEIDESSGYDLLDQAALTALEKWKFKPATHAGLPVASVESQVFIFRINSE